MELVKELKTIRERQAETDCTGFVSVKKRTFKKGTFGKEERNEI